MARLKRFRQLLNFDNWAELAAGRTVFRGTNLQVHRVNGVECIVDHRSSDSGSVRYCIGTDAYRQYVRQLELPESINVLDAGANAGGFSLMLMVDGFNIDRLVCVEMNPRTCNRLRFNVQHNKIDAEVLNAALVGKPRTLEVHVGIGSTGDSIYRHPEGSDCYEVDGLTLNQLYTLYFDGIIDICKVDIEGAESEVFAKGADNSALANCRYLITELHHERDYISMIDALADLRFAVIAKGPNAKRGVHLFKNTSL